MNAFDQLRDAVLKAATEKITRQSERIEHLESKIESKDALIDRLRDRIDSLMGALT